MTHILKLSRPDPVIHLKAYGGVRIKGVEQSEVQCEIKAPQLATMVEEGGQVYITVNSSCSLSVPVGSSIQMERGMGSVKIVSIHGPIQIEKVLGNLSLQDVGEVQVEKVGGNFAVRQAAGAVSIEKAAGNLVVADAAAFECEKTGGSAYARDLRGDFFLGKAGGSFKGQSLCGMTTVSKIGGSFTARDIRLKGDLKTGGSITLGAAGFEDVASLKAGGDIKIKLDEGMDDLAFSMRSAAQSIKVKTRGDDIKVSDYSYDYQLGAGGQEIALAAGGSVSILDDLSLDDDLVGDLDKHFDYEESAFSEMIQSRVESATRRAEAKVKTAEIRLEKIREQVEKTRGFNIDFGDDFPSSPVSVSDSPTVNRPAGQKGATDEERLMILQMLQDGKVSVDEAETLFQALEE